jgi:hypothetical protein
MANYVDPDVLKASAEASEASDNQVWDTLAEAVSRLFDRECEVPDDFFAVAPAEGAETIKTIRTNGTKYLEIGPYIADSITALTIDGDDRFDDDTYYEQDGYLIFESEVPTFALKAIVTARFGFSAIPGDIAQACIEQALFMWRKKDLAFTEMSGVSSAVITAEFSPTFAAVAKRYRGLYSQNSYFV